MSMITKTDRPQLPAGYGLADLSEGSGLLPWSVVEEQLVAARNYWVATTRPDGRPHCVPVWGVWVEGAFYFGTDDATRTGRNLHANPSVVVHLESGDDVVILEGVAERVSGEQLAAVSAASAAKYGMPEDGGESALRLRPQLALAWQIGDFPGSATRWRFAE